MTLTELIGALEKATGPSRELDIEVCRAAYPRANVEQKLGGWYFEWDPPSPWQVVPRYTASIDAALTLGPDDDEYEITTLYRVARVTVGMNCGDGSGPFYGSSEACSVPIALCIASLKARTPLTDTAA